MKVTQGNVEKILVNIPSKKVGEWMQDVMVINKGKTLYLNNYVYELKNISKLKIMLEPILGVSYKIKFSYMQNNIIFSSIGQ